MKPNCTNKNIGDTLRENQNMKEISIIAGAHNEEECLGKGEFVAYLFSYLKKIDISTHVVIIDDGSTDNTREHLELFKTHPNFYFIDYDKNKGLSVARNIGIENSQSEIICFLDSDMVIQPDWLQLIVVELMAEEVIGVIGNTTLPKGEEPNLMDHYFYSAKRGSRQFRIRSHMRDVSVNTGND